MKPGSIYNLIQELKRRRVFRGIVVYGASTLILLEAATNLANVFGHESAPQWFVWLLGIGFLGSLWFSWIYDITPGGIKKTEPVSDQPVPIPRKEVKLYQTTTFISVIIIIGFLTYNIIDGANKKKIKQLDKSIAVLPLHDITLNPSQLLNFEFIGHQITSCLLKVKDYRVIPWENCRTYPRRGKHYPEMGDDLSASLLVDWKPYETDADRRLTVQLISVDNNELLMSENYKIDGDWSTEICRHSRNISKKITRKLRTYLTPKERALINEQPVSAQASLFASIGTAMTQDAWRLTVTGNVNKEKEKNELIDSLTFKRAINYFTDAIKEDPAFAEAYANRAKTRLWGMKAGFFDSTVLDESREDIEMAFQLDKNLPEAHIAMGFYYYYALKEYRMASISFEKALEIRPNNNEYLFYLSKIYTTLGKWQEVRVLTNKVFESNPQNALFYTNLGISYLYLDEFPKAILCQDRAIKLIPQWYGPYINKAYFLIYRGEIAEARATVDEAEKNTGKQFFRFLAELDLYEEKYSSAAKLIELADEQEFKDIGESDGEAYLIKAKIYKYARKSGQAKDYYSLAVEYFSDQIAHNPDYYYAYTKLGLAYAGIGKDQLAIESGQKALEIGKKNYSAVRFPNILYDMAQIYALTGTLESAQKTINEILDTNSQYTSAFIKIDPDMKNLLNDPGI
ncbi:MAG: hypothetical protein ABFS38_14685 [Bacteroidota bacterium]